MPSKSSRPKPEEQRDPYELAVKLLARREHSRGELAGKLIQRGVDHDEIDVTLDALEAERLLSDTRFAEQFVRQRLGRGQGPAKIRAELRQRGVADSVTEDTLAAESPDWYELALEARNKRFGNGLPDSYNERARQARFLNSRGFTAEQIGRVLNDDAIG